MNNFKFDKYGLYARIVPAVFTVALPIFIFSHFYINPSLNELWMDFRHFALVGDIAVSTFLMFFLAQYARLISKGLFEKVYFQEELYMPTTTYMLFLDSVYTKDYKTRFRDRVKSEFNFNLNSADEEKADELDSRKKIVEAIGLIRKKLFENKFLFQHNIEYGAMRNSIGGAVIGIVFCTFNCIFFRFVYYQPMAINISIFFCMVYFLLIILSKWIIIQFGKAYAKILFREFMY